MDPVSILTSTGNVPVSLALIVINLVALGFMYRENKKQINIVRETLTNRIANMEEKMTQVEEATKKKVDDLEGLQRVDSAKITEIHTDIRWIKDALRAMRKS